jgi:predicted acetylornithine/succinylornithine family transaminase
MISTVAQDTDAQATGAQPTGTPATETQHVMELEKAYLLQNYARYPVVLHRGKGCYVYDTDGNRYLDLITGIGVNALGHSHPRIVKVIRDQAGLLLHSSNLYYHEYQGRLAERLAKMSGLARTFFCNSGTEGIEGAMKMMRAHGRRISEEKHEIVALDNSFHGRTFGALSITGQPKYQHDFEPLLPGARFVPMNDITALEQMVGERTAGIVIEWIQGEGGINLVSSEFAHRTRELADRYNALLLFDETQCGVGRTGRYFGYQLIEPAVLPDVMVTAKPLACGIPLGCIVANERAAASIALGMHGSTFGGNVLACRVALEFADILDELLPHITQVGAYFRMKLEEMAKHFHFIRDVRGVGLMLGVELAFSGKQIVLDAMKKGLLINATHDTVLRFLPPYVITEELVDRAVAILRKVLRNAKPPQA